MAATKVRAERLRASNRNVKVPGWKLESIDYSKGKTLASSSISNNMILYAAAKVVCKHQWSRCCGKDENARVELSAGVLISNVD
jgi:hypothetical protein